MIAHLYKVTNEVTGEYYYGKHNGWDQIVRSTKKKLYWGSGRRIKRHIKKYSTDNLKYEILCYGDLDYIFELENRIVTPELLEDDLCLNLTVGGNGISYHTSSTRKLISEKVRKSQENPEVIKKISDGVNLWIENNRDKIKEKGLRSRGRKSSEETKSKLSNSLIEYYKNPENRKKLSESLKGRILSEEHKRKVSIGNTGKIRSEETKQKIREKRAEQVFPEGHYKRLSKTISNLVWINNTEKSKRVKLEVLDEYLNSGWMLGRLTDYVDDKYRKDASVKANNQWKESKKDGKTNLKKGI